MARAGNDKGIKEWFDQNVLAKLSDAERELISQARYDLYYGPGGELEDDEDYPGFSTAVERISDALDDYRTDLWLDPDSGFISDAEPEGYYSDPDPDYDDEDAEAVWNEPEPSIQYDWSDVKRIGLGSELSQYVNPGRKPNPPKGAYPQPDAFLWDADANRGQVVIYAHVGQHSEGDIGYFAKTLPAKVTDPEVKALKRELENIGYVLHVVERRPRNLDRPASFGPNDTRVTFRYPKQATLDRAWGKTKKMNKNPHDELTDEQIAELLAEAIEVGDVEMVEACELAIDGDGEAIMVCIQAISYSEREGNPKKAAKKKVGKKKATKKKTYPGVEFDSLSPSSKRIALAYREDFGTQPYLVPEGSLAPFVAVHWHGGQSSALYALSSTGILDKDNLDRALSEFNAAYSSALDQAGDEDEDENDDSGPDAVRTAIDELEEMRANLGKYKIVGFPSTGSRRGNPGAVTDDSSRAKRMMNPQNY